MNDLFVYGTLQDRDLLAIVLKKVDQCKILTPAYLEDFVALYAQGEQFPVLVAQKGNVVRGALLTDLCHESWSRLDYFEDHDEYFKERVTVHWQDEKRDVFVYSPKSIISPSTIVWNYDEWCLTLKKDFLKRADNYMKGFGVSESVEW